MISTRIRISVLAATGVAAALTLAACSSGGSGTTGTAAAGGASAASSAAASSPAGTGSSSAGGGSGSTDTASLTEFHIALGSSNLSAGTYTFNVDNAGKVTHALTISGPGVDNKSTGDINPGSSATMTVTLSAGTYDVFCPVGNHKMLGMDETLTVA